MHTFVCNGHVRFMDQYDRSASQAAYEGSIPSVRSNLTAHYPTAFAAARPAWRPENKHPPRNVPSSER